VKAAVRVIVAALLLVAVVPSTASADTGVTFEQRVAFAGFETNACTGEEFYATGYFHIKTHQSVSLDGRLNTTTEFNFEDIKGIALVTGATYIEAAETSSSWQRDFDFVPQSSTYEDDVVMNRLGENGTFVLGDDLYQKVLMHYTVNANGTLTANQFDIDLRCR